MNGLFVVALEGFAILVEPPFLGCRILWLVFVTVVASAFAFVFTLFSITTSVATPIIAMWPVSEAPAWTVFVVTLVASSSVLEIPAWGAFIPITLIATCSVLEVSAWTFVSLAVLASWSAVTVHLLCLWQVAVQ